MRLEECCTACISCGVPYCRDMTPSPGETDDLCPSCYETEDGDA